MKAPSRVFLALLNPLAIAAGRITGPQAPDPVPIPDPVFISISPERIVLSGFDDIPLRFLQVIPSERLIRLPRTPRSGVWFYRLGFEDQSDWGIERGPELDAVLKNWARTNRMGGLIL